MTRTDLKRWIPSIVVVSTLLWLPPYQWLQHYYDALTILQILYSLGVVFVYLWICRLRLKWIHIAAGMLIASSMITSLFTEGQFTKLVISFGFISYLAMIMQFQMLMKRDAEATMFTLMGVLTAYLALDVVKAILNGPPENSWTPVIYFSGGKFSVGYTAMLWMFVVVCCWRFYGGVERPRAVGALVEAGIAACALIMMVVVDSMTIVLALLAISLLLGLVPGLMRRSNPWVLFAIFLGAAAIIFAMGALLRLEIVSAFIENVLGRSATLTGRERIYNAMAHLITQKPVFGLGRTATYVDEVIGLANVQNGLMQVIYQYGFFGGTALSLLVFEYLRRVCRARTGIKPVAVAFFLGFVVCSIVEIPYAEKFFYFLALSYALTKSKFVPQAKASRGPGRTDASRPGFPGALLARFLPARHEKS